MGANVAVTVTFCAGMANVRVLFVPITLTEEPSAAVAMGTAAKAVPEQNAEGWSEAERWT
ncbi:MAG: hypothetical protein IJP62_02755 [Treponema sp.]|nr:hypothetical protein [Treponema sp.]